MRRVRDIRDWSALTEEDWRASQEGERHYWTTRRDPFRLLYHAEHYFYAGFYEWTTRRALLNPFRVDPSRPDNFQIPPDEMEGRVVLEVGCGPASRTLSLVHCATVHALDSLLALHREVQSFGWSAFASLSDAPAEELPYDSESIDFVHCWKMLSLVRDPDRVLREMQRVLVPGGQLLMGVDLSGSRHPGHLHAWTVEVFEGRVLADFEAVIPIDVQDDPERGTRVWVCRLRKRA